MGSLWFDVRYALRMMVKAPGLTAVLTLTLALGIGVTTTIFSVVNSVVIKPLPYEKPDELVRVYTEFLGKKAMTLDRFWVSAPEYDDLRKGCRSCASIGAWTVGMASISGGDRPVRVQAAYATYTLLPLLGVQPMLGRFYDEREDQPGDPTVIILGHGVWTRSFASDASIIGRKITVDAMPMTVIGVMPPGFDFLDRQEAWIPLNVDYAKANRGGHYLHVVARLQPGVSLEAFRSELRALTLQWFEARGSTRQHRLSIYNPYLPSHPLRAEPFQRDLVGSLSTTLWLLQGAVLFVLLISIVNVANLLLARSETRTREVAVRHALGASRRRLVRQFVTESLLLGVLGGVLGVFVAVWAVDGITALIPKSAPRASEIGLDGSAVAFAVACSIVASLLFGIAPIVHARRSDLHGALKDGSPRMTGSKTRLRVRRALVIAEIALAVVLVIGCTVMVRSFVRLQHVEVGMNPDKLLTFEIELPQKRYPGVTGDQFWQRLTDRLRALPGVTHVAAVDSLPPQRPINANDMSFPGRKKDPKTPWNVDYWNVVGPDALPALGARLVRGRTITASDALGTPQVVLVNEAFVRKFLPGEDPLGVKVQITGEGPEDPTQTIVGVIADIKQMGVDKPAGTEVIAPLAQYAGLSTPPQSALSMHVVIRTTGDPLAHVPAVHRAVNELDPTLPVSKLRTMDDLMWEAVARPRFLTFLLSCFAGIALLLAAVGIYGVMAHTVAQRTHEIGLRVALGAQPSQVRAMVLRQAGILVGAGVALGLLAAVVLQLALASSLKGVFYGGTLSQPVLLAGVAIVVTLTALLATVIPVRRATRVQPTVALRSE